MDHALGRVARLSAAMPGRIDAIAVNAHHGAEQIVAHLEPDGVLVLDAEGRRTEGAPTEGAPTEGGLDRTAGSGGLWVSWERERPLGTAGALGGLRDWLDGRGALVLNGDAWTDAPLEALVTGWDGETARVLVCGSGDFSASVPVAGAIVPWADIAALPRGPAGLYGACWQPRVERGALEVVTCGAALVDCGTPPDYLRANLAASGGRSVVGEGATVHGSVQRSVVWPGAVVYAHERLVDAVRTTAGRTVLVR